MSAALEPHCWNATSLAAPEYVMDFRSPNAFCALAITAFASCAMALPRRNVRQIAMTESVFDTASSPYGEAKTSPGRLQPCAVGVLFGGDQRFEQGDGFRERLAGCLSNARYPDTLREIERCSAVRVLRV